MKPAELLLWRGVLSGAKCTEPFVTLDWGERALVFASNRFQGLFALGTEEVHSVDRDLAVLGCIGIETPHQHP